MERHVHWEGDSLNVVTSLPKTAKRLIGHELHRVQSGLEPTDWKPMSEIGAGVREIRIHSLNEYRVLYITKIKDAVHILHAFVKKTQKTSKQDIEIAKKRYQLLIKKKK